MDSSGWIRVLVLVAVAVIAVAFFAWRKPKATKRSWENDGAPQGENYSSTGHSGQSHSGD